MSPMSSSIWSVLLLFLTIPHTMPTSTNIPPTSSYVANHSFWRQGSSISRHVENTATFHQVTAAHTGGHPKGAIFHQDPPTLARQQLSGTGGQWPTAADGGGTAKRLLRQLATDRDLPEATHAVQGLDKQPLLMHPRRLSQSAEGATGLLRQEAAVTSQHDQWTHSHVQQAQGRPQPAASPTPWLLPPSDQLPYKGFHNDLAALLRMQRTADGWVTVFMFSTGVSWWAINAVYSYIRFGKSTSYIMAAPDADSLSACLRLRLPCLNMSAAGVRIAPAANSDTTQAHGWKTAAYYALVWAKVELVAIILRTGHHVHFSDIDVVYLREVWPSYTHVFNTAGPDAVFMKEQWQVPATEASGRPSNLYVNMFNTGVYAIRSNQRSLHFMSQWYGSGSQRAGNQPYINAFVPRPNASFGLCTSALDCNMLRRTQRAAVLLHAPQSDLAACPPPADDFSDPEEACSDERLFIHYICSPQGWGIKGAGSKGTMLDGHSLRLLDRKGHPVYRDPDEGQLRGSQGGEQLKRHPFLPCVQPVAWRDSIPQPLDQTGQAYKADQFDHLPE